MYRNYPNTLSDDGSFTSNEVNRGFVALHTDYECPVCGRNQGIPQMGGYGGDCIQCGASSNPAATIELKNE